MASSSVIDPDDTVEIDLRAFRVALQPAAIPAPAIIADPVATMPAVGPSRSRLVSVDILRGLSIVLMALDHVRDYFSRVHSVEPNLLSVPFFLTRWVTHFCAPTFCFLAGVSAFLTLNRGRSVPELSRFLLLRGLWLIVAEATVVGFGWHFNLQHPFTTGAVLQVIWALGVSMIVLAGLVRLPMSVSVVVGVAMVAGHNLFDGVDPHAFGAWAPLWQIVHTPGIVRLGPFAFFAIYPLVPWIGVMALGYAFGPVLTRPEPERRRTLVAAGLGLVLGFVILRAVNGYGDPHPWLPQATATSTVLSFLNVTKYPPSLLYLLMTIGPAVLALAWMERWHGRAARILGDFGRVPLFFYLTHIYVIHALAVAAGLLQGFPTSAMLNAFPFLPKEYGVSLPAVYAIWLAIMCAMYPACRWFATVKASRRQRWLSYL